NTALLKLLALRRDEQAVSRPSVQYVLSKINASPEHLLTAFKDRQISDSSRLDIIAALADSGDRQSVAPLAVIFRDRSEKPAVRAAAAAALAQLKDFTSVEPLTSTMADESDDTAVRASAARALSAIGDRQATDPLILAL